MYMNYIIMRDAILGVDFIWKTNKQQNNKQTNNHESQGTIFKDLFQLKDFIDFS